jgi:hypothetical protein
MPLNFKTVSALLLILCSVSVDMPAKCISVRRPDFRNRAYPLNERGFTEGTRWLRVKNGRYEEPHENPPIVAYLYFQIAGISFRDLTGDGIEDAAVVAIYGSASGNFYLTDTYIFSCVAGEIKLIGILKQSQIENDHKILLHESVRKPLEIRNDSLLITHNTTARTLHPSSGRPFVIE